MRRRERKNYTFKRSVFEPPIPKASRGSENKVSACNTGDLGLTPGSGRPPGEGNGNLLQDSRLENPMDRGAWWAAVHGVTKSQTQPSDFIFFFFLKQPRKRWSLKLPLLIQKDRRWVQSSRVSRGLSRGLLQLLCWGRSSGSLFQQGQPHRIGRLRAYTEHGQHQTRCRGAG